MTVVTCGGEKGMYLWGELCLTFGIQDTSGDLVLLPDMKTEILFRYKHDSVTVNYLFVNGICTFW